MLKVRGFTLAELLITIGIIGVISAITIPSLINKTQEMENYNRFRKKYSEIANATSLLMNDYGGKINATTFSDGSPNSEDDNLMTAYLKYLKLQKMCSAGNIPGNCWNSDSVYRFDNGQLYGGSDWWNNAYDSAAILSDGSYFLIYINTSAISCNDNAASSSECARMYVDVNGIKKPNQVGKDIFNMNLHQTKLGYGREFDLESKDSSYYGGTGFGMTGYCLTNKCP